MIGARLAHYEITGHLGTGGMGEVYQATDSKLGRSVAIKLLPEALSHDSDLVARFEREARVLASLNHPNIATIYGVEESAGRKFLVMELVGGETMADRIRRGPIPVAETLGIAAQITEALEAAHEKGIVHRDLKPANIKLTSAGVVKVLDFGLAKALGMGGNNVSLSNAETMMTATKPGMILGTAAYMSPEQANGKEAGLTADVWAFGCVLYEMLTARPLFEGNTVAEVLSGILKVEPDWSWLPADTPEGIRRLLRHCLQKDQKLRFRDFRDVRLEINEAASGPQPAVQKAQVVVKRSGLVWVSALLLVTVSAALIGIRAFRNAPTDPEYRLEITTPPTRSPESLAISPDGRTLVFSAASAGPPGPPQLWLRSLDSGTVRPLAGTEGGFLPFWSPDNRSIGFFASDSLKRLDIDGGLVQQLAHARAASGGAWNADGTIVYSANPGTPLVRIPAKGGDAVAVTTFQAGKEASHAFPQFLPDARHFLFYVTGSAEARGVYIGQLDGSETRRLFDADGPAAFASTGYLLFMSQGTLFAQNFDPAGLKLKGNPFPVIEHVGPVVALSTSAAGSVVYRTPAAGDDQRQFVWIDRSGVEIRKVVYPDNAGIGPALSPDGRSVALFSYKDGNMDIWSYEIERRAWNRITFDAGDEVGPIWSPDGSRMVFGSNRVGGILNLYRKVLSGPPGSEELLLASPQILYATDWSPNGFLLYDSVDRKSGNSDIWALPMEGDDREPIKVVHTEFVERGGQFSPDGKWIAYQSNRSGKAEIYVEPFPRGSGDGVLVSTNGGVQARWNPRGKELFYIGLDGRLMSVPIHFASDRKSIEPPAPAMLFATRGIPLDARPRYMVSPDGKSFVMNSYPEPTSASPVTIILNWKPKR